MGLICKLSGHKWNGCKCTRCGAIRDEQHDWDLCKGVCRRCRSKQPEQYDWKGHQCSRCGEKIDLKDINDQLVLAEIIKNGVVKKNSDHDYYRAAMQKLNDQVVLKDVAMNGKNFDLRIKAAKKLTDYGAQQAAFLHIAKTGTYGPHDPQVIVPLITEEHLLAEAAKKSRNSKEYIRPPICIARIERPNIINENSGESLRNIQVFAFSYAGLRRPRGKAGL